MTSENYENDMDLDDNNSDIEYQLEHLKEYDNEKQLDLLRREVDHIRVHGITPSEGWYDERFEHINIYSKIGWLELAKKFHNKDQFIHDTAIYTIRLIDELLEERSTRPNFHIPTYYGMIHNIQNIWNYYKQVYCDGSEDTDMTDLVEGMSFLMK